ncbi:4Fe-4S binding protein [Enterocloster lavalensis]|uniref:4Fe-4S binding protein n=1 Tax=Enterocloster lavalensis TaxID=460384 RepID=UPI001D08E2B3|nr:4Fe-4S binding protein [Enterocloster lavalensis]MCB6346809.1 4Fe-4S binding protein [Enterocloster lavalensis]
METRDYLRILKDEIHSTVFATVDEDGLPVTRVIDIMLVDEDSLYFITAKGKEFYRQLMNQRYVAVSGMTGGEGSMEKKAVSVRGRVANMGGGLLDQVFAENPYMAEIYPTRESRQALEVFRLYEGRGEYFDLSAKPIIRRSFRLGEVDGPGQQQEGYHITADCDGCGLCLSQCPQNCIDSSRTPYKIQAEHCLHCGNCVEICPRGAARGGIK